MVSLARQVVTFGGIGALGFLIDATVFSLVNSVAQDLYLSRVVSYLAAASATWFLNRKFTFTDSGRPAAQEWRRFILLQACGGAVNYGVYAFLVSANPVFNAYPIAAIAAGSIAGMGLNFLTAKFLVFKPAK